MRIFLFGFGKMGKIVARLAQENRHAIVTSIHEAEVCIDFSKASQVIDHVISACSVKVPLVIGTTGWESHISHVQKLVKRSGIAALYAPNFSLGVALFQQLLIQARSIFSKYAIAGVEYHHEEKKDAPSGTAKKIAKNLKMPQPFSSVRCGEVVGKHEVIFDCAVDTITLTHDAKNREGFALGALKAAQWIISQKGWFTLDDMLHSTSDSI